MTVSAEALAQRLAQRVIDLVVQAIDINALLGQVDLNALLRQVDVNAQLARVDVNAPLDQLDLNALLRQVDVNAQLARLDVNAPLDQLDLNALLRQVDINTLLDQVDMNAVLDRVDINDVVGRIDMEKLVEQTDLGAIIARSTGGIATEALDSARSGAVGLDQRVDRWVTRLLRRKEPGAAGAAGAAERGGSATSVRTHPSRWLSAQGRYAGSVSRFAAYLIDLIVSSALFELALTAISFVSQIITGREISWHRGNIVVIIIYVVWQFAYFGAQWAGNGKTLGMTLLGVHVVQADGARLKPWRGWVRSLTFPLGFLTLGLGFLGILVQRKHRALYDLIAGTAVVYAWDARAARLRFLARQAEPIADAAHGPGTTKPAAVMADRPVPLDQTGSTADLLADASRSAGCCGTGSKTCPV
jgi:uncharacterized RDD family membrane protein YckC